MIYILEKLLGWCTEFVTSGIIFIYILAILFHNLKTGNLD